MTADGVPNPPERRTVRLTDGVDQWAYTVRGRWVPDDGRLGEGDLDLLESTGWSEPGHLVAPLLSSAEVEALIEAVTGLLALDLRAAGLSVPPGFTGSALHNIVTTNDEHRHVLARRRGRYPLSSFPLDLRSIEHRVSDIIGQRVHTLVPPGWEPTFGVRTVRPGSLDQNPLHRDSWLDHLRHSVTAYVPVEGSTPRSSLTLVPHSGRGGPVVERTASGATIGPVCYSVPAAAPGSGHLRVVRPEVRPGEVLLFSPYLLHGGARNNEPGVTRVSLELRFWTGPRNAVTRGRRGTDL